jgi:hypothetical protein
MPPDKKIVSPKERAVRALTMKWFGDTMRPCGWRKHLCPSYSEHMSKQSQGAAGDVRSPPADHEP